MRKFLYFVVLFFEITQWKINWFSPGKYGVWEMIIFSFLIYVACAVVIVEVIMFLLNFRVEKNRRLK